MNRNVILLT